MLPKDARREEVLESLDEAGGLRPGAVAEGHRRTGVPEADVYGVATFYHLLADPDAGVRVCRGLSCKLSGCDAFLADLEARGEKASYVSCLGRCDLAPAFWDSEAEAVTPAPGLSPSHPDFAIDLAAGDGAGYEALALAVDHGPEWVCSRLETADIKDRCDNFSR